MGEYDWSREQSAKPDAGRSHHHHLSGRDELRPGRAQAGDERPGFGRLELHLRRRRQPAHPDRRAQLSHDAELRDVGYSTFVQILALHQSYAPTVVQTAIEQALQAKLTTAAGVRFCLDRLLDPTPTVAPLNLAEQPALAAVGHQALSSARYDQFLTGASA